MTYQEFCNEFKQGVLENKRWGITEENYRFYPDGLTADGDAILLEFIRNTNAKYHRIESDVLKGDYAVLCVTVCDDQIMDCRYAMHDLYKKYEECGWDKIWEILEEHLALLLQFKESPAAKFEEPYEKAKYNLMIRPINYTDNKYLLKEHIYKVCGDIALVVYMKFYDDERGLGGAKLPKTQLVTWNKGWEEVFDQAFANTIATAPPRAYQTPWLDINDPEKGEFMSEDSKVNSLNTLFAPLVTTTKKINGAIAMFYPGVKERLAELIGGSFYVAFTSIHEARIHLVGSMPPRDILRSLKDVNKKFPREEVLSRKVFLYDAQKKTFEVKEL